MKRGRVGIARGRRVTREPGGTHTHENMMRILGAVKLFHRISKREGLLMTRLERGAVSPKFSNVYDFYCLIVHV
jgi:hypothetical protein